MIPKTVKSEKKSIQLRKELMRANSVTFVQKNQKALHAALLELATGAKILKRDKNGFEYVYKMPPDPVALRILLEHGVGRPKEVQEMTGEVSINIDV